MIDVSSDEYESFFERVKSHANTKHDITKYNGELQNDGVLFKMSHHNSTSYDDFTTNPCYQYTFPDVEPNTVWSKDQISPLIDIPFQNLLFRCGGNDILQCTEELQELFESTKCGGYTNLRKKLSNLFTCLKKWGFRKLIADHVVSLIAISHGFNCHCLAKMYCQQVPQVFRELLSTLTIDKRIPLALDYRYQIRYLYFLTEIKAKINMQPIMMNLFNHLQSSSSADDFPTPLVLSTNVLRNFDLHRDREMSNNEIQRPIVAYRDKSAKYYNGRLIFDIVMPASRIYIYFPKNRAGQKAKFDRVKLLHGAEEITNKSSEDCFLISTIHGDWFWLQLKDGDMPGGLFINSDIKDPKFDTLYRSSNEQWSTLLFEGQNKRNKSPKIYIEEWNVQQITSIGTFLKYGTRPEIL